MRLYLRNKTTGEIRDVEADSDEFREIVAEVTTSGQPRWEQTNYPHAAAIKERAAFGELQEEDLGHEQQDELRHAALVLDTQGVGPEQNPHLELTPGEIEMGLTRRSKLDELKSQFDDDRVETRSRILDGAADHISDERRERDAAQASRGQSARAGGSDEPFAPQGASDEEDSSEEGPSLGAGSPEPVVPSGAPQEGGEV